MAVPFIISGFVSEYILPFVLSFVLVFAILQKSKLLGDDVKQINAIIALVIGLMFIAFPFARNIVVQLEVFAVVFLASLFVFMMIYGFATGNKTGDILSNGWKYVIIGILAVSLVIALIVITGYWDFLYGYLSGEGNFWLVNAIVVAIIGGVMYAILRNEGKK